MPTEEPKRFTTEYTQPGAYIERRAKNRYVMVYRNKPECPMDGMLTDVWVDSFVFLGDWNPVLNGETR